MKLKQVTQLLIALTTITAVFYGMQNAQENLNQIRVFILVN
ncbi:MAG: hypothetical protein RIR51_1026 [Bacteroidota bacterium]